MNDQEVPLNGKGVFLFNAFPPGTPVRVRQVVTRRGEAVEISIVGVIQSWEELPTGSWYAHGKRDKLWLRRLKLRKKDGEVTLLVMDDGTRIAKLEALT